MSDYLVKALAYDGKVRAYAVRSTAMVQEAARRHDTWRTVTAALGRSLSAATMMGAMLKGEEKITVKIEADGPATPIIVDANATGEVRGYVSNPHVDPDRNKEGKLNVAEAVGRNGSLSVVKYLGLKDNFTGSVPLVSGELGEDFTYYFAKSEQTPTSVGLGVIIDKDESVAASGGFIIQLMPGITDDVIDEIENKLNAMEPISKLIQSGLTPEELLHTILGEENVRILDQMGVAFQCQCSKERISNAIMGLNEEDISAMIEEDGGAETQCHFCNEKYVFDKWELQEILDEKRAGNEPQ
ncbi:Hsp33 family molecular chaperone HslO [Bacillus sp. H-16]|uniref:Hsp33 family molecular chaperone HslO n=1 Tax=Alteribacter salitolerans TaxID=2912333 RepID=UPI0019637B44|nr:Hsp33 family molecular chaperone HslO [Alteribacter salitolerans]MBM7097960.1 Hsp33 family molecular chaperone HslO [Alteribacter salitolerans]